MRDRHGWIVMVGLVLGLIASLSAPPPVSACGHVKCEEPGSPGCWECTYSLYQFQRCKYWCRVKASGAIHSTCWEEECFGATDVPEAEDSLLLASLGLSGSKACPGTVTPENDRNSPEDGPRPQSLQVTVTEVAPRS